ncbi:MAG: helix-turn-helix transcriptional regulator [Marinicaulis sp.]|nr:helix-turn-helix transcriptional regulator [Marinicaulis sp.]
MGRTLDQKIKTLPKARRAKIEARAAELIAEEATLQDLRKAFGLTQTKMAKKLRVGQDTVSRVEKRTDMLLSTLSGYVEAMGGELNLVAEFPDRPPVKVHMLDQVSGRKKRAGSAKKATRRRKAASA